MDTLGEYMRAVRLLPPGLRRAATEQPESVTDFAEEIRLRAGQAPFAVVGGREVCLNTNHVITTGELQLTLEIATRASAHTYSDSIKMGYVTAEGGCRLGLCGTVITEGEGIKGIRRLSSVCIRIPREKRGCGDEVFRKITQGGFQSTLIVSPPGGGKTTLLRELVRRLSDEGKRVSLIDERSEVAGIYEGNMGFDVGAKTDVLNAAPKAQGVYLVMRAMSPQVIAFDEITAPEDIAAAEAAANCGVALLATAHAFGPEDFHARPLYQGIFERKIFKYIVSIENISGKREYRVEEF